MSYDNQRFEYLNTQNLVLKYTPKINKRGIKVKSCIRVTTHTSPKLLFQSNISLVNKFLYIKFIPRKNMISRFKGVLGIIWWSASIFRT